MSTPDLTADRERPTAVPAAARRGFPLVVLAALCWGTSGLSGAVVARRSDLGPLDIAWHRMAIGAVVLLALWAATRRRSRPAPAVTRGTVVRLLLVGAGLAAYQLAYFAAVAASGVSIATLVALGLAPLLIAVGASLLGHGRPDRTTAVALVVALVGLVLLVGVSAGADTGTAVVLGALLAVGSALGYTVVTLAGAGVPAGVPVTLVGFALGALLLTPVALAAGLRFTADPAALAVLLYLGTVPSAAAYAMFFTGLRTVPGAVASIVTLLEPLTATALAALLLGERLAPAALAGGLLVLAAVAGLYLRRLQRPAPVPPAAGA
ncbi:DMT family transporter [Blastococcus saxobsidens]|uniref:Multidrug resistance efflux transporter EmrE n=1 Tax=Blastococcus saxobsidens (strain DD2) TaxID=1146883 RepID=H6RNX6_BLASD|nr:EamA family transporter [Blastococcus saxobsidens]CCG01438.1 Multidrug resistance efflux transporter EmrE [Blastococcus saxobsidens DD2]